MENGQLAEEVAHVQVLEISALPDYVETAGLDEVHGARLVTGANYRFSRGDLHGLESFRDLEQPLLGERAEDRMQAQEVEGSTRLREPRERVPDIRIAAHKSAEDTALEPERLDRLPRANGGGTRGVVQQADLAEVVALAENMKRHLVAAVAVLDDTGRAGGDDVERVRHITLGEDDAAERVRDRLEGLNDDRAHVVRQPA